MEEGNEARQLKQKIISHIRHINRSLYPRAHLEQLKDIIERHDLDERMDPYNRDIERLIEKHGNPENCLFVMESLKHCSVLDVEIAAKKGVPLTLDTLVERSCTHGMSVELHLRMVDLTNGPILSWEKRLEDIWNVLEKSIPEVQAIILAWLNKNRIERDAKIKLREKLNTCDEALKALPGYNTLFLVILADLDDDLMPLETPNLIW